MNKLAICIILNMMLILLLPGFSQAAEPPQITATGAALIDKETGQILYAKNGDTKRPPASLTKVLTGIIVIENSKLDEIVVTSKKAAYQEGSSIYLIPGEKLTVKEMLYGILLASGNDAAVALAEHVGGSVEEFAKMMNAKAKEIGAKNSNFVNPSGMPAENHYSTALDLAKIMRYAMQNDIFREIISTKYKTISWPGYDWDRGLRNHNKLLWRYDGCDGGKTGYTKNAGRCLLSSSTRNGRTVIAVTLNSPDDWFENSKLMDYGFENYKNIEIVKADSLIHTLSWPEAKGGELGLYVKKPVTVTIEKGGKLKINKIITLNKEISLPISKGEKVGQIEYRLGEKLHVSRDLFADRELVYQSFFLRLLSWLQINLDQIFNQLAFLNNL